MPRTLEWQTATVERVHVETPRVKSFRLATQGFEWFRPGQHVDVRLTAPDGYQAQRSYSIASAPGASGPAETSSLEITVEVIEGGEVSPYFHEVVREGDQIELRGPIGGPFTWTNSQGGPLLLIGGGSGVVPLMSMLRHRASSDGDLLPAALLYSSRTLADVIYREELERLAAEDAGLNVELTLTRESSANWSGLTRRVDAPMLKDVIDNLGHPSMSYICGSTGFVETVASTLVDLGLPPEGIRTERFGPSGS